MAEPTNEELVTWLENAELDRLKHFPARLVEIAQRLRSAGEWRDISTAPKDGTRFIAYNPGEDQPFAVVFWCVNSWKTYEPAGDGLFRQVVRDGDGYWEGGPFTPWHATHWQPLPPPPVRKGGEDHGE